MNSKKLTWGLFIVYLAALTWIIVFKFQTSFQNLDYLRNINLIPFGASVTTNGMLDISEIIQNALAFIPFGIFVCVLGQRKSFLRMLLPIVITTLAYETVQFVLAIGASDITDVIANTLGGIAGIGIFLLLFRIFKEKSYKIANIILLIIAIFMALLLTMIFLRNW